MAPVPPFKENASLAAPVAEDAGSLAHETLPLVHLHETESHARNLCLVWPDGRRMFLNYAYLMAGEFDPEPEKNVIQLRFSSCTATLQGYSLEPLFLALLDHLPRLIQATDERYVLEEDRNQPVVVQMTIEQNDG